MRRRESTESTPSKSCAARAVLFDCTGPMQVKATPDCAENTPAASSAGCFAANSCTRFSPKSRSPAVYASTIASGGCVFETAISRTDSRVRSDLRHATAICSSSFAMLLAMGMILNSPFAQGEEWVTRLFHPRDVIDDGRGPPPCILRTRPIIKSVALTLKLGGMYAGVGHPSHGTGSAISVAPGGGTGDSGAAVQNSIPHRAGDRRAGPVVCSQPSAYFPKSEHGISGVSATAAVRGRLQHRMARLPPQHSQHFDAGL